MKNYLMILILLSFAFYSCEEKNTDVESQTFEKFSPVADSVKADIKVSNAYDETKLPDGNFKQFYPNDQLKVSGMVENGKRTGTWVSYHTNGNKQSENQYDKGQLHGKTVTYFPNGQIMYIGYYKRGLYEGDWLYYNKEGIQVKKVVYKAGKIIVQEDINPDSLTH